MVSPVVLDWRDFLPEDVWQCLEAFLFVAIVGCTTGFQCGGIQDAAKYSIIHISFPQQRIIQPQMSTVLRLRKPGLDKISKEMIKVT